MQKPKTFQEFCNQFLRHDAGASDGMLPDASQRPGVEKDPFSSVVKIGRRYYYDPQGLLKLGSEKRWDVFSVGLYLGEERGEFRPTSALIDLLATKNDKRVLVGSKAAWLYLCGRDILMDGVLEAGNFNQNELVFVADHQGTVIGYGKVYTSYNGSWKNKIYVKHVLDKGEYLRRER